MTVDENGVGWSWHRRERRLIPPFGDGSSPNQLSNFLDSMLAQCRFAPFPEKTPIADRTYFLDARESERRIEPKFAISIDGLGELTSRLGLQSQDLELGLSVCSRHLRQYEVLERWPVDSLPEMYAPNPIELRDLQSARGMDFILAVRVTGRGTDLTHLGLGQGKTLCRKFFSVRESADTLTFPFKWVEFGGNTGYPEELLWTIEWNDVDDEDDRYRRPVAEALTVLVNSKAENPLLEMAAAPGTNDLGWKTLAAEITTQIWADVLSNTEDEPEEDDSETLAGQVFARLHRVTDKTYPEVKALVEQDDSLAELRCLVARIFEVVT